MSAPASKETLARLDKLITTVPPRINSGSYNLSVAFKASVVKGIKVRHKHAVREFEAALACQELEGYAKEPVA